MLMLSSSILTQHFLTFYSWFTIFQQIIITINYLSEIVIYKLFRFECWWLIFFMFKQCPIITVIIWFKDVNVQIKH